MDTKMGAEVIFGDVRNLDPDELKFVLQSQGIARIDTAARYMNGESEKKIGKSELPKAFDIDTKILATETGDGNLTPDAIEKSLSNSLKVLGIEKVHVLYCHTPDNTTPISIQAKAFNDQYKRGRFSFLGVSNFSVAMLREWLDISEREGYVKPSVFQGQYNLLCRNYEEDLFPLLRQHNMRFGAYSPLAGGFLLGNFTAEGVQRGSRFTSDQSSYRLLYDRPIMHEAVRKLRDISARTGLGMEELSLRWLKYHSILREKDWMILGASNISQVGPGCQKAQNGPLEAAVAEDLSNLWKKVEASAVDSSENP